MPELLGLVNTAPVYPDPIKIVTMGMFLANNVFDEEILRETTSGHRTRFSGTLFRLANKIKSFQALVRTS